VNQLKRSLKRFVSRSGRTVVGISFAAFFGGALAVRVSTLNQTAWIVHPLAFLVILALGFLIVGAVILVNRATHDAVEVSDEVVSLRKAFETTQLGVTINDVDGKIVYTNPAEARNHGYKVEELIGQHSSIFAPVSKKRAMKRQTLHNLSSWQRETYNKRKDGTLFPVQLLSDAVRNNDGDVIGVVTISEDITYRRDQDRRLRESEERYALASRGANDVLWDWDLTSNILYLSPRWKELLGKSSDSEFRGDPHEWMRFINEDDAESFKVEIAAHMQGISSKLEHEHRLMRPDGRIVWVRCRGLAVRNQEGKATRIAGSMTDISEHKRIEHRLQHDALYDSLTELPNRAFFIQMVDKAIKQRKREPSFGYAVLFVDMDRMKFVNDSLGHLAGDDLLRQMAIRLKDSVRPRDTVARLGGDEFTILLDEVSQRSEASEVAQRIVDALARPFSFEGNEFRVSASIGIALAEDHHDRAAVALRDADLAMYRAKHRGKDRFEFFEYGMHEREIAVLQLENDLPRAVERGEMRIVYQPIVSLNGGKISGFEALVRWHHPEKGLVLPDAFIGLAEETGMIVDIGKWVLTQACLKLREWQDSYPSEPPLTMSINLSPKQFSQVKLVDDVRAAVSASGVAYGSVRLEITETLALERGSDAEKIIRGLAQIGVHVLIDDFGTGYSSFGQLQEFEFHTLKIDRSFVSRMGESEESAEIVKAILSMARSMGMAVIAEGIETDEQWKQLREMNCEHGQGYLFSRPVDADTAAEMLASGKVDAA